MARVSHKSIEFRHCTHAHLTVLFPGLPGRSEVRDSEWQWHQLGHMQVSTSLQTDNQAIAPPLSFLQPPNQQCQKHQRHCSVTEMHWNRHEVCLTSPLQTQTIYYYRKINHFCMSTANKQESFFFKTGSRDKCLPTPVS